MTETHAVSQFGWIDIIVTLKRFPLDKLMHFYEFLISLLLFPVPLPVSSQKKKKKTEE